MKIIFCAVLIFCFSGVLSVSALEGISTDFDSGNNDWQISSDNQQARIDSTGDEHGKVLLLTPEKSNIAVSGPLLQIGKTLNPAESYELFYELKLNSVAHGKLAVSLVFYNASGKIIKQYTLRNFERNQSTAGWQYFNSSFGKSTDFPFPDEATTMQVRFSFWAEDGMCTGHAMIDRVRIIASATYHRFAADTVVSSDAMVIEPRFELNNDRHYYWLEGESFAIPEAVYGNFKYRYVWSNLRGGIPEESGGAALSRPVMRAPATASASFRVNRNGYYNLWLRIKSANATSALTLDWNGISYELFPSADETYHWYKANSTGVKLKKTRTNKLSISTAGCPGSLTIDAVLITDDLQYEPPASLLSGNYFSVLPYNGVPAVICFRFLERLGTPLYICRGNTQVAIMEVRNCSGTVLPNGKFEVNLPDGLTMENPVTADLPREFMAQTVFLKMKPDGFVYKKTSIDGKNYNSYTLTFNRPIPPYNSGDASDKLFLVLLNADKEMTPGNCQAIIKTSGWNDSINQPIAILNEPAAALPRLYEWGIDGNGSGLLNQPAQKKIMQSFERAGMTVWASKIVADNSPVAPGNLKLAKALEGSKNLRLVCWGDRWWPASYDSEASRDYLRRRPEAIGAWRNDEIGNLLAGKLLCPQYLIQGSGESYIREHLEKWIAKLMNYETREYIEDLTSSVPESFCFCPQCKAQFAEFSGIPLQLLKELNADRLLFSNQNKWIEFRCWQNSTIVDKITTMARQINPEATIRVYCDIANQSAKKIYGVDWQRIVKLKNVEGIYAGSQTSSSEQLIELAERCRQERKSLVTVIKLTDRFTDNRLGNIRNQAYLEAKVLHDMLCGAGGTYLESWVALDGKNLNAIATASKLGEEYGGMIQTAQRLVSRPGITAEFVAIEISGERGKIIALLNPSQYTEDMVLEPETILKSFQPNHDIINLISGEKVSLTTVRNKLNGIFKQGEVAIWFLPASK